MGDYTYSKVETEEWFEPPTEMYHIAEEKFGPQLPPGSKALDTVLEITKQVSERFCEGDFWLDV